MQLLVLKHKLYLDLRKNTLSLLNSCQKLHLQHFEQLNITVHLPFSTVLLLLLPAANLNQRLYLLQLRHPHILTLSQILTRKLNNQIHHILMNFSQTRVLFQQSRCRLRQIINIFFYVHRLVPSQLTPSTHLRIYVTHTLLEHLQLFKDHRSLRIYYLLTHIVVKILDLFQTQSLFVISLSLLSSLQNLRRNFALQT